MYHEVAVNCFRYLGFRSFEEVDNLTIPQYLTMIEALRLREVDLDYRIHQQAFLNFAATAQKKSGKGTKPKYGRFRQFFNYEAAIKKAQGKEEQDGRMKRLGQFIRRKNNE